GAGFGEFGVHRLYPVGFSGTLDSYTGSLAVYSGELTSFGGGGATTVPQDLSQPATLRFDTTHMGIDITYDGDLNLSNSPFGREGRANCALIPRAPGENDADTHPLFTLAGDYNLLDPGDTQPLFPYDHG